MCAQRGGRGGGRGAAGIFRSAHLLSLVEVEWTGLGSLGAKDKEAAVEEVDAQWGDARDDNPQSAIMHASEAKPGPLFATCRLQPEQDLPGADCSPCESCSKAEGLLHPHQPGIEETMVRYEATHNTRRARRREYPSQRPGEECKSSTCRKLGPDNSLPHVEGLAVDQQLIWDIRLDQGALCTVPFGFNRSCCSDGLILGQDLYPSASVRGCLQDPEWLLGLRSLQAARCHQCCISREAGQAPVLSGSFENFESKQLVLVRLRQCNLCFRYSKHYIL